MQRPQREVGAGCVAARWIVTLIVAVFTFAPGRATAQIVNVQGAIAKPPAEDGVAGQLELKLDLRRGNNELLDLGASGTVLVRHGRLLALVIARGEYGRGVDTTFKRKTFEHARVRASLDERWKWEAFAQHELDTFRRLTVRALTGTGPAFQVLDDDKISLLAGAAYFVEYERFDDRDGAADAGQRGVSHRASFYLTGTEQIGESVAISQTVYVQPRLDDPADLRLLGELAVTTKLSKHIALTDGLTISYDRTPPDGIKRHDVQLRVALLITF